jgi:phosphoribosylglycinamide formyltransferase-1
MNLGVLISGRGSNMLSIAAACAREEFPARVAVVVSNVPGAGGLEAAAAMGIPTAVVDHREFADRPAFDRALVQVLRDHDVEAVALAGFMRIVTGTLLDAFPDRVLNIHPSLLPSFPGAHAHRDALAYGAKVSGCTVHLVTEEMDAGPIVVQAAVPVNPGDDEETLAARVLEQEHRLYPEAVRLLAMGRLRVDGRRVEILE